MGDGWYFRGQRYNRHKHEEACGVQKDDHRLQTGQNRPDPDQVPLPLRPEHGGLPGGGADAPGQRYWCDLRKGKYQHFNGVQRVPAHAVQRLCPGGERVHQQKCDLGYPKEPGGGERPLPVFEVAGLPAGA